MNATVERPLEVLLRNLQRLHTNIVFADRKAGVLMAADSGLLAAVYALIRRDEPVTHLVMALIASFLLIMAISAGFAVITPRGRKNRSRGKGIIDVDRIAQFESAAAYVVAATNATPATVLEEMQILTFDYAWIDKQKYTWLRVTVFLSGLGAVLALVVCFLARM